MSNDSRLIDLLQHRPMSVEAVARELDMPQSTARDRIADLERQGLVQTSELGGKTICRTRDSDSEEGGAAPNPSFTEANQARTVGVVSGKGGVGKTVVTLNLATAMRQLGEDVIVIDSDAEMSNLGIHLGMYTYPTSLHEIVDQDVHIMSAMHVDKDTGLRVIPTSLSAEEIDSDVEEVFSMLPEEYTVLVDSPPGFERPIRRVMETCDQLVFVTTPELPAVTDTYKLYQEAQQRGKDCLGVIVNMYKGSSNHMSVEEVEEAMELQVLGTVEYSEKVQHSIMESQPVTSLKPHTAVSRSFKQLAADLTERNYSPSVIDRLKGVIQ